MVVMNQIDTQPDSALHSATERGIYPARTSAPQKRMPRSQAVFPNPNSCGLKSALPNSTALFRFAKAVLVIFAFLAIAALGTGCKLVELKMPGEPMPKADFALRGQTREFANMLSATVQHVADSITRQTGDAAIRTHCAQWKIGAVSTIRTATLRSTPKLALLDAWAFCRQMTQYLDQGGGSRLFGPFQVMAVTNAQALEQRLTQTARTILSASEFSRMDKFLADYVAQFPVQNLSFDREPVVARWEDFEGKLSPIPPAGTSSEALSDFAERLQMLGQQVPDEIRWRLTLEADEMETQLAKTGATLDRLDLALKLIAEAAMASPGTMTNAVQDLRSAFLPVLERFQGQWETTTKTLQTERQALTETLATERTAVLKAVDEQRAAVLKAVAEQRSALMKEAQAITQDVVDRSMKQVHGVVREVLFYAVLALAIVLGLPFLTGFLLGRASGRISKVRNSPG